MKLVAKDKGGDWYFDGDKTYWRLDSKKKPTGKLYAKYIPDPVKLQESKCKAAGIEITSPEAKLFKTGQVATKLWEHHSANINK